MVFRFILLTIYSAGVGITSGSCDLLYRFPLKGLALKKRKEKRASKVLA